MAADVYRGITVEFRAKTTGVSAALSQLTKESRKTARELNQVDKALRLNPGNLDLLRQKQQTAARQAQVLRERIAAVESALRQTGRGTEAYDRLTRDLATTRARLVEVEGAAARATAALRAMEEFGPRVAMALESKWRTWDARAKSFGQLAAGFDASARAFSSVGGMLTRTVTPAVLGLGVAATKVAIDYESAFAGVQKTVDMTDEEFDRLYDSTLALSEVAPISATDIMYIEELGGQLGIANDSLLGFAETIAGVGTATNLSLEDAATEFAQFANITGMSQNDFDRLASTLVGLGNNAATTESDIMQMAMRIAGAGTSAGMSVTDIMAMSTTLSSLGINAEAGGTAISTIISNIDKQVATNGKNLETWADTWAQATGKSASEFAQAWKDDPVVALEQVIEGMASMQDEGGNLSVLLEELGVKSIRQTDAFKRMANGGDLFNRMLELSRSEWKRNGALQDEVNRRYGTTESQLQILKNRIMNAAATLGGPLASSLSAILGDAEPLIKGIAGAAEAFANMDEGQRRTILTTAGMVAALGPLLKVMGKVSSVGGVIMRALESFAGSKASTYKTAFNGLTETMSGVEGSARRTSTAISQIGSTGTSNIGIEPMVESLDRAEKKAKSAAEAVDSTQGGNGLNQRKTKDVRGEIGMVGNAAEHAGERVKGTADAVDGKTGSLDGRKTSTVVGEIGAVGAAGETAKTGVQSAADSVERGAGSLDSRKTSNVVGEIGNVGAAGETAKTGVGHVADAVDGGSGALNSRKTTDVVSQIGNVGKAGDDARGRISSMADAVDGNAGSLDRRKTTSVVGEIGAVGTAATQTAAPGVKAAADAVDGSTGSLNKAKTTDVVTQIDNVGDAATQRATPGIAAAADAVDGKAGSLNRQSTSTVVGQIDKVGTSGGESAKKVRTVGTEMGNVNRRSLSGAVAQFGKVEGAAGSAAGAIGGLVKSSVVGAITTVGATALIMLGVTAYQEFEKNRQKAEEFAKAVDGVSKNIANIDTQKLDSSAEAMEGVAGKLSVAQDAFEKSVSSRLETIDHVKEIWDEINTNDQELSNYVDVIKEMGEKSDLSASDANLLKVAVDGVNRICGEGTVVIDENTGAIIGGTEAVLDAVAAWEEYAKVQGYMQTIQGLYSDLATAQVALNAATDAQTAAQADLDAALAGHGFESIDDYTAACEGMTSATGSMADANRGAGNAIQQTYGDIQSAASALETANKDVEDAQALVDGINDDLDEWKGAMDDATGSVGANSKAIEEWLKGPKAMGGIIEGAGADVTAFSTALAQAGLSVDDLEDVSTADLRSMAEHFDGTTESIQEDADRIKGSLEDVADAEGEVATKSGEALDGTDRLAAAVEAAGDAGEKFAKDWADLKASFHPALRAIQDMGVAVDQFGAALLENGYSVDEFIAKYESIADAANPFKTLTDEYDPESDGMTADKLLENMQKNAQIVSEWKDNIAKLYGQAGDEASKRFVAYLETLGPEQAAIIADLANRSPEDFAAWVAAYDEATRAAADAAVQNTTNGMGGVEQAVVHGGAGVVKSGRRIGEETAESMGEGIEGSTDDVTDSSELLGDEAYGSIETLPDEFEARGKVAGWSLASGIGSQTGEVEGKASSLASAASNGVAGLGDVMWTQGRGAAMKLRAGMTAPDVKAQVESAGTTLKDKAIGGMDGGYNDALMVGKSITMGLAHGIADTYAVQAVIDNAADAVRKAVGAARDEGKIESPSRVMIEVGRYWDEGLALGIEQSARKVSESAHKAMAASIPVKDDLRPSGAMSTYNVSVNLDYRAGEDATAIATDIARALRTRIRTGV